MNATSPPYTPGIHTAACACNVVAYSLASACSWCQGTTAQPTRWVTQAEWERNCTTLGQLYLVDRLPRTSRPPAVVIPLWPYMPPSSGTWNPEQARVASITSTTTSMTRTITTSSASPTTSSPVPPTDTPRDFEGNKHIPEIIMICVLVFLCLMGIICAAVRKIIGDRRRQSPDPELPTIVSSERKNPALTEGSAI